MKKKKLARVKHFDKITGRYLLTGGIGCFISAATSLITGGYNMAVPWWWHLMLAILVLSFGYVLGLGVNRANLQKEEKAAAEKAIEKAKENA